MALVSSGNPLTGTSGDDYLIAYEGTTNPNTIINAGDGNDVVYGDSTIFFNTMGTSAATAGAAINSASNAAYWTRSQNDDITNSTIASHASVFCDGSLAGQQGWLAITVAAGQQLLLDVDYGANTLDTNTDTVLRIFAADGVTLLAINDDDTVQDRGSTTNSLGGLRDSTLGYTFTTAGTYYINISDLRGAGENFSANDSFMLHMSLTGQAAAADAIAGDDTIDGGSGNDVLYGMGGNDIIIGGLGLDWLAGGSGNDRFVHNNAAENGVGEIYLGGEGTDTLEFGGSGSYVYNLRDDLIDSIDKIKFGNPGSGNFAVAQFYNWQFGSGLSGSLQVEVDAFSIGTNILQINVVSQPGFEIDLSSVTFINTANAPISVHIIGDVNDDEIFGSTINDLILGGTGGDFIRGQGGNDTIYGGVAAIDATETGNDRLYGDGGNDSIYGNGGDDIIFGGMGEDFLIGGTGDDQICGGIDGLDTTDLSNDFIRGGDGLDTLYGNSGNDTVLGGAGNDTIYGGAGNDILYGGALLVDATDIIDHIYGGTGADDIRGNGGNDILFGGSGDDSIIGGLGNDEIRGGTGNDYLRGGADADTFIFDITLNATTNIDTIHAFVVNEDHIVLSDAIFNGIGAALEDEEFQIGAAANDIGDRIIYNQATGQLFFDPDGNTLGGAAQTQFAVMTVNPGSLMSALTIADFVMIA
jgi:Ca2+-binding RTX toxin-like protein